MNRRRWLIHTVLRALSYRKGRTFLLLAVLAMSSSLATALLVVSSSMGKKVAEEVRKYGANLIVTPRSARLDIGSGGLNFGVVSEPSYLQKEAVEQAISKSNIQTQTSFHLRGTLKLNNFDIMVEGVNFMDIRRLSPWWQLNGSWPKNLGAIVGHDLALRMKLKQGDRFTVTTGKRSTQLEVSGIVSTGGEEDAVLFVNLPELQQLYGLNNEITLVKLMVTTDENSLKKSAASLQLLMPNLKIIEVRQTASTSEGLLAKVKLLMFMVTAVVLISAGSSVAGTMSTTVLERSKEIGLMKSIGGTRMEVMLIFSGESALLALIAGLVGYLLGSVIAEFITKTVFSAHSDFVPYYVLLSLGVSLFLALLGSIGPMMSVFRLDPVRSLRGE